MRRLGRAVAVRFAYESTFGTPLGSDYYAPEFYSITPPADPDFVDDPVMGGSYNNTRDPIAPLRALPGGTMQMAVPFDLGMLGHWLRQLLGALSTSGSGNYTHTKSSGGETLESVTIQVVYDSGDVLVCNGCKLDTLAFDMAKEAAYQQINLTWQVRDWTYAGAVLSGSAASAPASVKLTKYAASAAWNGVTMADLLACTFSYSNILERYNTMSGDEFPSNIDTGLATLGGTLRFRSADETYRALSEANTADDLVITLALAGSTSTRNLTLTMANVRLHADGAPITGPGGIDETFSYRPEQTSGAAALAASLKNATASYA